MIVTTRVNVKPFGKVSKTHAFKEGEGDRSLKHWRETHKKFFEKRLKKRGIKFDNNTLVVCEEFKVVKLL